MNKHQLQLLIYLSALLLSASVFFPLVQVPVYGVVSYYRAAEVESCLIIFFALSAPALILIGKNRWCFICAIGIWGVLLFPAIKSHIESKTSSTLQQAGNQFASAMQSIRTDFFLDITEFSWGGFVFLLALLLFTASSIRYQFKF